eukprot:scaffold221946_cov19-Tisochrysis_lutea.AAC.1
MSITLSVPLAETRSIIPRKHFLLWHSKDGGGRDDMPAGLLSCMRRRCHRTWFLHSSALDAYQP